MRSRTLPRVISSPSLSEGRHAYQKQNAVANARTAQLHVMPTEDHLTERPTAVEMMKARDQEGLAVHRVGSSRVLWANDKGMSWAVFRGWFAHPASDYVIEINVQPSALDLAQLHPRLVIMEPFG
jgi:hypothetical protein